MDKPIRLHNTGVLCYFNSLLQNLLSLDLFVKKIKNLEPKNKIIIEFQKIISEIEKGETDLFNACPLLNALTETIKEKGRHFSFGQGQQDSEELFTLIIDLIDDKEMESYFAHKYEVNICCYKCQKITAKREEEIQFRFMYTSTTVQGDVRNNIDDELQKNFQKNVLKPAENIKDYKCDICNTTGNCVIVRRLLRSPPIMVFMLNKQFIKINVYFPQKLEFPGINNIVNYQLNGVIDHFGTRFGGHYICRVKKNDQVYLFNDASEPRKADLSYNLNSYLIFYTLKN